MRLLGRGKATSSEIILVSVLCAALPWAIAWFGVISLLWLFIAGVILTGLLGIVRQPEDGFSLLIASTFTMMYIGLPFTSVILLRHDPIWTTHFQGAAIIVFVWGAVWATDTFAYLAGRKFGKHALSPQLSPKKTIEGTVAGIFMAIVWTSLVGYALPDTIGWMDRISLGIIIGVMAVIGDLVESMLKRAVNVKDSGSVFFGHGGVLDRFDSLLFVQPAAYLYLVAADVLSTNCHQLLFQ
ncbi:MAG TPA: phosphatidate cytidylyltransferase [Bacteroidetes bacterium]|nr:phosphatidate cytidylyltransferase [bacterium BMS3Bbin04]HDO64614.1 phosphatidate cytidylyltransferase [Bacteroidota bacterium]HEX03739.1 phosphatidate cytidylyltransferase [Bacteroidota bacterium]